MADPQIMLLDLDAAGIDLDEPCPPDFMQFVYENSQDGHLTLWSKILSEPDGSTKIQQWFDAGLEEYHSRSIQIQMAPPTPEPPTGDNITEVTYPEGSTAPPVNVDVPHVSGNGVAGEVLNCTMGNWDNTPTSYAYQWQSDGMDVAAASGDTYTVDPADQGKSITCVVTATNSAGSTEAPPSNAVVIAGGARGASNEPARGGQREYPKRE